MVSLEAAKGSILPAPPVWLSLPGPLAEINERVLQLFAMVSEGLAAATAAFLDGDRDAARRVVAADQELDALELAIEDLIQRRLVALPVPNSDELRGMVAILRIVPELERSGDLVEHIALRTPQGMADQLSPRARGLIEEMGQIGVTMWQAVTDAYANLDPAVAQQLRAFDDELDDLHVNLSAELATSLTSTSIAIEMGLVARFLERLGDHAVNVARRLKDVRDDPGSVRQPEPEAMQQTQEQMS
jgi:phosphate transport system protein